MEFQEESRIVSSRFYWTYYKVIYHIQWLPQMV